MTFRFPRSALAIVAGALSTAFMPQPPLPPSLWAGQNFVVPDGEYKGAKIDLAVTPYLREPLDHLSSENTANEVAVMKSAQSGFSTLMMIAIGHTVDREPCDMMVVQPTDSALTDFNSQKLGRTIEKSQQESGWGRKVRPQTARSGTASTTYEKKFGDCSLVLAISNSAADLSSKTVKKAFLDEIDRYPDDVDGQGSPIQLAAGRQKQFEAAGTWKRLYISTPTFKGNSEIERRYLAGDQRRWHVVCPQCAEKFVFAYGPNFKFNRTFPYNAHYVAPCCGRPVEGFEKNDLVQLAEARGGGWIATAPGPGKYPSYHFEGLSSPFSNWDLIAKEIIETGDDPEKLKPLYNLTLGLPYEVKGDAPDHVVLMGRREDYTRGHVPPGALLLTIMCDVQMRGIYYEVVAWTPDRRSYVVDVDYIDGATTDHDHGAFKELTALYHRTWPDAHGNRWRPDEFGVDSGYRSHVVYSWTRGHPGTKALKGVDGWNVPALGTGVDVDIDYRARRIKGGAKLRSVGTWPLKGMFYSYLSLERKADGARLLPPAGYCHFGTWLDENYFRQITSEYLADETYRGKPRKVWKQRSVDNHWLDCRVGNHALAHAYLTSYTADDWATRAKERGIPEDMREADLFAPRAFVAPTEPPVGKQPDMFDQLAALNRGV